MEWTITPLELETIKSILAQEGFDISHYKDKFLRRRVEIAFRRSGIKSRQEYIARMKQEPVELKRLEQFFSINVTRFFRNYETFEVLEKQYFPQLIARKRKIQESEYQSINVWSVGCANGAEPYTLAILFAKILGDNAPTTVKIVATDYNPESLAFAKMGIYPKALLEEIPDPILRRYFTVHSPDHYQINKKLQQMVQFRFHDLLKDPPLPQLWDVIVCRNVLIYFARESQERIFQDLTRVLVPRGLLVLGRTEVLHVQYGLPFTPMSPPHRIYQKA